MQFGAAVVRDTIDGTDGLVSHDAPWLWALLSACFPRNPNTPV